MSQKFEKLKGLLKELFQLDQPDLDFGLYRIMHAKAAEVTQFLDRDLLPQVKEEFSRYKTADKADLDQQLAKAIEQAEALGADPETLPKVKELRAKLADDSVDIAGLESEVYDHLFGFFRRYYSEGDFLSKRVYKPGVYAIPYEGEEVKLHWANADQYYIKTSEYLRDYAFRLRPEDEAKPMRVHFRLVDAAEGQHSNIKSTEGKDRVFVLAAKDFIAEEAGEQGVEMVIGFEYRPATLSDWPDTVREGKKKPPTQKDLTALAEARISGANEDKLSQWIAELAKPHIKSDGAQADYSRLHAHLSRYVARNTFDYFIHKDLGGFLRRELDFYIKNELMHLDDVENETAPRVEQYLSKIRVVRRIAGKLIDFLAQLEDFQKKMWLKKKFVVDTSYCIAIGVIPEEFYNEIATNDAQREEWTRLFAIDEIQKDLISPGYSAPLTVEFLKSNPTLPLDTRHFSSAFTCSLLATIPDIDKQTDGVLVHSDNFHALQLLQNRFRDQARCVYIDPPYNTDVSAIPYKNNYRHSSFASMLFDRIALLHQLLAQDGTMFVSIDDTERQILEHILDEVFGRQNRIEELIWIQNTNDGRSPTYSTNHEYVEVYAKNKSVVESDPRIFREPKPGCSEVSQLIRSLNGSYPPISEIEQALRKLYRDSRDAYRQSVEEQGLDWETEQRNDPWKGIYQYKFAEYRDDNGRLVAESEREARKAHIWVFRESDWTIMSSESKQSGTIRDESDANYRFYQVYHPITKKPCSMPSRGWKGTQLVDPQHPDRNSWDSLLADHRIAFGPDENKVPQQKRMLHEVETNVAKSVFVDYSDGEKETTALFGRTGVFLAPKHSSFVGRFLQQVADPGNLVIDCFGGSGSTAHAVITANRDGGHRKYVIAEVNTYFDTLIKPRVLKAAYSSKWRGGKPAERDGIQQIVKLIRLESYEDALNNLELHRAKAQQTLLDVAEAQGADRLREQYILRYMLNVETEGSPSLLNVQSFTDPTSYLLRVKRPGSDESREVAVDLLETFNWLIGISVQHIAAPQSFAAKFERDGEKRLQLKGRLKEDDAGQHWFRTVTGTTPDGRKTLVIWRNRPGSVTAEGIEQDNLILDAWFTRQGYSSKDSEFDLIYVNGTNNLENLRAPDDTWKVRLIEDDFHRLMFASEGL